MSLNRNSNWYSHSGVVKFSEMELSHLKNVMKQMVQFARDRSLGPKNGYGYDTFYSKNYPHTLRDIARNVERELKLRGQTVNTTFTKRVR